MALEVDCVEVIIMKLSDELLEFLSVLIEMDIGNLGGSQASRHPLGLQSLLFGFLELLIGALILALDRLDLLVNPIDLALHGVLLLDHLPLE